MKYALITGATSGIGYELARKFAHNHYGVIMVSSSQERLESSQEKLEKEFSASVKIYKQDLSIIGAAASLYDKITLFLDESIRAVINYVHYCRHYRK